MAKAKFDSELFKFAVIPNYDKAISFFSRIISKLSKKLI